jgi:Fe-S-cluster containining protein
MADPQVAFSIKTDPKLNKSIELTIPDKLVCIAEIVPFVHFIADQIVKTAIDHSSLPITCGKGCGVCCNQLVPLSIPEVFFIVEQLRVMPPQERFPILSRFDVTEKQLIASNFIQTLRTIDQIRNDRTIAEHYFNMNIQCPFLDEQSCTIHPWRPVVCREFNALSEPKLCADPFNNKISSISYIQRPSSILAKLFSMITDTAPTLIPMPLLFESFEQHQKHSTTTWQSTFLAQTILDIAFGHKFDQPLMKH